jgi:hypothetical protein
MTNKYSMSYLELRFENAKLVEASEKNGIKNDSRYLISHHQLSNVLHVLMGLRPVPLKRKDKTMAEMDKNIEDMAKNAYIKYDYNPYSIEKMWQTEFIQTNKAAYNSHRQTKTNYNGTDINGIFTWDYMRRNLSIEQNEKIIDVFQKVLGSIKLGEKTLVETVIECKKHDYYFTLINGVVDTLVTPWRKFFIAVSKEELKEIFCNTQYGVPTTLINNNGVGYTLTLSGKMYLKVHNYEYEKALLNNSGLATLLDGGIVYVTDIRDYSIYSDTELENDCQPIFVLS